MNSRQEQHQQLRMLIEPVVDQNGFELVDVELGGTSRQQLVRVFIYRSEGVSIEDCVRMSRALSAMFDIEDPMPGRYTLEVSSPGLDRPLKTTADFKRNMGERLQITTTETVGGDQTHRGVLEVADQTGIGLNVEGSIRRIEYNQIAKARIEIPF